MCWRSCCQIHRANGLIATRFVSFRFVVCFAFLGAGTYNLPAGLGRCPGFVLRSSYLALGGETNEWNLYFTDGGDNTTDIYSEDKTFDSTVLSPGYYW